MPNIGIIVRPAMSKFAISAATVLAVIGLAAIGGCVTSYQAKGALGGFDEKFPAPDVVRVRRMSMNQYSSGAKGKDLALMRSAEIMLEKGLPYFAVLYERNESQVNMAPKGAGNQETGMPNTVYIRGDNNFRYDPEKGLLVRGFKERPTDVFTFDAEVLIKALKSKYDAPATDEFSFTNKNTVPTDPVKLLRECASLHSKMAEIEDYLKKSAKVKHPDSRNLEWQKVARATSADLASRYEQIRCQIPPPALPKRSPGNP